MPKITGIKTLTRTALRSILRNKSRGVLTSLGIIIGVTSVILLMSIGHGLQAYITDQFESLGSNVIIIMAGQVFDESGGLQQDERNFYAANNAVFKNKHLKDLRKINGVDLVAPIIFANTNISFGTKTVKVSALGSTSTLADIRNLNPSDPQTQGRFFTSQEEAKNEAVVVLGSKTAEDLFGTLNPLGKKVKINSKRFTVVGIADSKGAGGGFGPNTDEQIYLPLEHGYDLAGSRDISTITIKAPNSDQVDPIKKEAEKILLKDFEKDSFSVFDQSQLLESINSILGILTIGLSGIAAISLVVGGIGIMNIMLVTVTERTREIGLRKALGATPNLILTQFLLESTILSLLGGAIGIGLGALGTLAIKQVFPAKINLDSVILSFSVAALVGIVFGAAPARRASRLSPIEALRYE